MNLHPNDIDKKLSFSGHDPLLRGSAPFSIVQHSSLEEYASEWDQIVPANHNLRAYNLLAVERSLTEDLEFRYLFIYKKSTPEAIAVVYFQLVHFRSKHYSSFFKENSIFH